jgi:hypothetical protein
MARGARRRRFRGPALTKGSVAATLVSSTTLAGETRLPGRSARRDAPLHPRHRRPGETTPLGRGHGALFLLAASNWIFGQLRLVPRRDAHGARRHRRRPGDDAVHHQQPFDIRTPSRTSRPARPAYRLGGRPTSSPPDPSFVAVVADHTLAGRKPGSVPGGLDQAGSLQAERGTPSKRSGSSTIGRPRHRRHHGRASLTSRTAAATTWAPCRPPAGLGEVRCVSAAAERFRTTPVQVRTHNPCSTRPSASLLATDRGRHTVVRVGRGQAERTPFPGFWRLS